MATELHAVVGINWGDEGKGRMIDYLAQKADMVIRYQGGNNAGHTVINERGTFKLRLVPSGIFSGRTVNILGPGAVIDVERLAEEIGELEALGVDTSRLFVSDRATVCFPFHRDQDGWEEDRLADASFGSTRRGIAPVYGDRFLKKAIQVGELFDADHLRNRLKPIVEWKNLTHRGLYPDAPEICLEQTLQWALEYGRRLRDRVRDVTDLTSAAVAAGDRHIIFEAQLGALRDILHGIFPFTTSSSTLAGYAPVGGGLPGHSLSRVTGVLKAFSTCVGEGPFVTEEYGAWADELRAASGEYGVNTGRPRRIGHFDAVASRYGAQVQGATQLAVTKLDSLSGLPELRICVGYDVDGVVTDRFPMTHLLERATPVYESMPGWDADITGVRHFADLPDTAAAYVRRIEELVGTPIRYVSVGPERHQLIDLG
ncbi:adenylosuccinate synthetase [Actinoplanes lobatus]|uniref:Adenylosuccinate synthetase n=1 Tax=Actinoplanes lobatus TaxID=113568 RepID=A0A7W7MIU2_9ACTN|nr:adenylosuccinate synthase [Actinoplanes lobatus]MBB4751937.1 adenylosuccinate synthase [Actinoplanes lobatus]GGN85440.1 adenylosuccinate synthetase [Actinoplanes lobatus]GIE44336.1 adenylosuccinate synthetase [Actinoplanes lobatus]